MRLQEPLSYIQQYPYWCSPWERYCTVCLLLLMPLSQCFLSPRMPLSFPFLSSLLKLRQQRDRWAKSTQRNKTALSTSQLRECAEAVCALGGFGAVTRGSQGTMESISTSIQASPARAARAVAPRRARHPTNSHSPPVHRMVLRTRHASTSDGVN